MDHWSAAETDAPVQTGFSPRQRPGQPPRDYPLSGHPYPAQGDYPPSRPLYEDPLYQDLREYPPPQPSGPGARGPSPDRPVSLLPVKQPPAQRLPAQQPPAQQPPAQRLPAQRLPAHRLPAHRLPAQQLSAQRLPAQQPHAHRLTQTQVRRPRTWPHRLGGVLIAGACVVSAAWYVPRVMRDDRGLLTGTVVSSGIVTLNFPNAGAIATLNVRLDQQVRKGQVLASQYMPNAGSLLAADHATIAADQAKIAELKAAEAADPAAAAGDNAQIAADKAQLALDQSELVTNQAKIATAEIVAPADGIVVAVNGQPGQTVTSSGIRDYATDSHQASASQRPPFSLLPEGPQPVSHTPVSGSALPVIALRVSATWQVIALIPENSVSAIKPGRQVTISVPAAQISGVRATIDEVLPTPASMSGGTVYQAVVTLIGHAAGLPLNGMAADVRLDS